MQSSLRPVPSYFSSPSYSWLLYTLAYALPATFFRECTYKRKLPIRPSDLFILLRYFSLLCERPLLYFLIPYTLLWNLSRNVTLNSFRTSFFVSFCMFFFFMFAFLIISSYLFYQLIGRDNTNHYSSAKDPMACFIGSLWSIVTILEAEFFMFPQNLLYLQALKSLNSIFINSSSYWWHLTLYYFFEPLIAVFCLQLSSWIFPRSLVVCLVLRVFNLSLFDRQSFILMHIIRKSITFNELNVQRRRSPISEFFFFFWLLVSDLRMQPSSFRIREKKRFLQIPPWLPATSK